MGHLMYAGSAEYEFDDRLLSHLKVVIGAKLRRSEGFMLNWQNGRDQGFGRVSLWLAPAIPLQFRFAGGRRPQLNPAWLQLLAESANSSGGLEVSPEPSGDRLEPAAESAMRPRIVAEVPA